MGGVLLWAQTSPRLGRRSPRAEKGLCVPSPACPRARSAFPQLRQTPEAPQTLGGQTQIVPGPAAQPVTLGTKLNRLTSLGRCVATGKDSPCSSPRLRGEVAVAMETAGLGRALPGRPVLLAPRPPGRALRSSLRRKGTSPSGENGASWPQGGWQGPRGGLKYVLPPTGISFPERPLFTVTPLPAPFWVPSLGSCSGDKDQAAARDISPHPHCPGHLSSVWLPALWEETLGPAHATLLPSLVPSSAFPWCLPLTSVL